MKIAATKMDVIIPCWNVEKYIKILLDSIDKQTLARDKFNIILVDNNSTDGTLKVLKAYQEKHSNVLVLEQKIQGPGPARQMGLDYSVSEWIIHLDSDGYISPKYLEAYYNSIDDKYDLIFGDNNFYIMPNKKYNRIQWIIKRFGRSFYNGWFNLFPWPDTTDPRSKMWRRDLIKDVKWTEFKRGEDWVFFADCLKRIRKNAFRRVIFNNMYFDHYGREGSTNDLVKTNKKYLEDQVESHYLASKILNESNHKISKRMSKLAKVIADKSKAALEQNKTWTGL